MSLKSREEEEEDVANNRERQQEQEQQPNAGLMNTAAFFSNFGETFSQVSNIAKEKAEILKEQMRLAQTTTTSSSRKEHFGEQEREEEQKNQQAGAEKKKNKGDYVRLPIESAKRLRALDTRDVNELEMLHKAQIAKVLTENELLREKLKQLTTSENGKDLEKMVERIDEISRKIAAKATQVSLALKSSS